MTPARLKMFKSLVVANSLALRGEGDGWVVIRWQLGEMRTVDSLRKTGLIETKNIDGVDMIRFSRRT